MRLSALSALCPLWHDLRDYPRGALADDLTAGVITAILLVPQGMAYALLAGLPPQTGLYASIVPPAVYALFGTSRTLAVGPVAVAALMVAEALRPYADGDPGLWLQGAIVLAAEVGLILVAAAALGLGRLTAFISHPVLSGFTSGAALLIIVSQLPALLGIEGARGDLVTMLEGLQAGIAAADTRTIIVGALALAALGLGRSPLRRALVGAGLAPRSAGLVTRAVPLGVVMLAALLVYQAGASGQVATVGDIPAGLPTPSLEFLSAPGWLALLPSAGLIALIAYVESVTVAKVLGGRRRERIAANRELFALGGANLAAAVAGTMPAAGGFSRSVVNFEAGARTQLAALVTAAVVALAALTLTGAFAYLPQAVLAAIIVVAVWQLVDLREAREVLRYDRGDGVTLAATAGGVLLLGLEPGLLLGIVLALLLYVWRTSRPHIAVLGRVPGTEHYRNVERHTVVREPGVLLLRVDENLYFANAEAVRERLAAEVEAAGDVQAVVLVMSSVSFIDGSALSVLDALEAGLAEQGIRLHLAEVKGPVADRLQGTRLWRRLAPERVHLSVHRAVRALAAGSDAAGAANVAPPPAAHDRAGASGS